MLSRVILGSVCLIVVNTLVYGFITWQPTFLARQGLSIATSFGYSLIMALGAPAGALIRALPVAGLALTVPIYVLVAVLSGTGRRAGRTAFGEGRGRLRRPRSLDALEAHPMSAA